MIARTHTLTSGGRPPPLASPHRQRGVALMLFLILTILGAAAFVLSELNRRVSTSKQVEDVVQTREALREAKEVLLGAATITAVNAAGDVRPGQLPWPDRNTDPALYDGRSDCVGLAAFNESQLLGQFPYLGEADALNTGANACPSIGFRVSLGTEIRDGTGAPLWYAVSRNLVHPGTLPSTLVAINPDLVDFPPFPWMRVCDGNGRLISDRVAAVILAPGAPLPGQDRTGAAPGAAQYLEGLPMVDAGGNATFISNLESDGDSEDPGALTGPGECREGKPVPPFVTAGEEFVSAPSQAPNGAVVFNDQLVFITADEIVHAVQKQAMNAVAHALGNYRTQYGRFPWLSPFVNAAVAFPMIAGTATGGGAATLEDSGAPFDASVVGAAVRNVDDGSTAVVQALVSPAQLTLTPLVGGRNNQFQAGDEYVIATFRGDAGVGVGNGTREGQLPFHDPLFAEDRAADFSVDWELTASNGADVTVTPQPDEAATYRATLTTFAETSEYTGPVTVGNVPGPVAPQRGVCRVAGAGAVRCQGRAQRQPFLLGVAAGASPTLLQIQSVIDAAGGTVDFTRWGIEAGDRVQNQTDGSLGVVAAVGAPLNPDELSVVRLEGGTLDAFSVNDVVSVTPAAKVYTGQAQVSDPTVLTDAARAQQFGAIPIRVDDVVFNQTDGSYGLVTAVAGATLTVSALVGGTSNRFEPGDLYQVRSAFVDRRNITFDLYYDGTQTAGGLATQKSAAVTIGARGTPVAIAEPPTPGVAGLSFVAAAIHIEDFDIAAARVGEAFVRIDGDTTGYVRTDGIERDFDVGPGGEIPDWIVDNGWHEYLFMAVAGPMAQTGVGNCATPGTCIGVHHGRNNLVVFPARDDTDVEAVVIGAGVTLPGNVRPSAVPTDYFEDENDQSGAEAGDDQYEDFAVNAPAPGFNDQVMIVR